MFVMQGIILFSGTRPNLLTLYVLFPELVRGAQENSSWWDPLKNSDLHEYCYDTLVLLTNHLKLTLPVIMLISNSSLGVNEYQNMV